MRKLDLKKAAAELELIDSETYMYYNTETSEFDFYTNFMLADLPNEIDTEKFEDDCWIAAPSQQDLNEYTIMENFAESVADRRASELLCVALEGKGAFRRFKDTLHRVGLTEDWYAFKREAYVDITREWCKDNDIPYIDIAPKTTIQPDKAVNTLKIAIIEIHTENAVIGAAEVLCDTLNYSKSNAEAEVRRMISKRRIALAAFADGTIVGIIGAIPKYGVTGWELHPLAVLKEYQKRGVGTFLIETLEQEVAKRGGVMIYLGSDDESGTTSLYSVDLYDGTFEKLKNIENIGGHPYSFYEKRGYKIVGVFPDANGIGKPDILMAKRIKKIR